MPSRGLNQYRGYCLLPSCDRFVDAGQGVRGYDGFKWQVLCELHQDEVIDQLALFVLDNLDHDLGPDRPVGDVDVLVREYLDTKPLTKPWRERYDALCNVAQQWHDDPNSQVDFSSLWL